MTTRREVFHDSMLARVSAMDLSAFAALTPGPASNPQGGTLTLSVHELGVLRVHSGRLEVADPFTRLGEGRVIEVSPGAYPVSVTVADVSDAQDGSHLREAYLSVVLADGAEMSRAVVDDAEVFVDSGVVSFADRDSVERLLPKDAEDLEELFDSGRPDSWFTLMDDPEHLLDGTANIILPGAQHGENVILSHSGWGDGVYPVIRGLDERGGTVALHIDLGVVGPVRERPDSSETPQPAGPLTAHLLLDHHPAHLGEVLEAVLPHRARELTRTGSTAAVFETAHDVMMHMGVAGRIEDPALLRDAACSDDSADLVERIAAHRGALSIGPHSGDDPLSAVLSFVVMLAEVPLPIAVWIPAQRLVLTPEQFIRDLEANVPLAFRVRPVEEAETPTVITRGFAALGGREVIYSDPGMSITRMAKRLGAIVGDLRTKRIGDVPQAGAEARFLITGYQLQPAQIQVDGADVLEMVAQNGRTRGLSGRKK